MQALADEVLRQETALAEGRAVSVGGYLFPTAPSAGRPAGVMASDDELATWLRAEIEADRRAANVKIIREHWHIDTEEDWAAGTGIVNERGTGVAVANGGYAAAHIVRHDPLDALADCEAKLSALALCERVIREDKGAHEDCGAADSWTGVAVARLTVQLMASGYRHREGFKDEWLS